MSKLERLFASMNLNIEANKTVTKNDAGIRTTVKCNQKPIVIDSIDNIAYRNRNQSIVFGINSRIQDCSFLFLEQNIHESLFSRISFVVSSIFQIAYNPELYNQVKSQRLKQLLLKFVKEDLVDFDNTSDNNLLSKWKKITKSLSEKSVHNGLIALNYKIDNVCVEDEAMIEYYKNIYKISNNKKGTPLFIISAKIYINEFLSIYKSIYKLSDSTITTFFR